MDSGYKNEQFDGFYDEVLEADRCLTTAMAIIHGNRIAKVHDFDTTIQQVVPYIRKAKVLLEGIDLLNDPGFTGDRTTENTEL